MTKLHGGGMYRGKPDRGQPKPYTHSGNPYMDSPKPEYGTHNPYIHSSKPYMD
ncbi:hypothetical protein [Parapedobacter soli]|uniref:hypothetical protein n=1 Tax=Parapedobacter soli TaxID=416955 RepID=UPI0021C7C5CC|nr:hypothetical protein [Parapedobacter soli]